MKYKLVKGSPDSNGLADFLKVIAVIEAIAGLIVAIVSANVQVPGRYGTETVFQFGTFISLFLTYLINAFVLYGLGTAVEHIAAIYGMVNGLMLVREEEPAVSAAQSESSRSYSRTDDIPASGITPAQLRGSWRCSKCGRENQAHESVCRCGNAKSPTSRNTEPWVCPRCGERNFYDATRCTKCGSGRS